MFILETRNMMKTNQKLFCLFLTLIFSLSNVEKAFSIDGDYSKAAGHTGAYINPHDSNIWALKCSIQTFDHTKFSNKLGWYTAWPMIVDYKTGKFVQTGYITSPLEGINKPTFYVAWSSDGKNIKVEYLPNKNSSGNALKGDFHQYAISLNMDGTVNVQIDGIKYYGDMSKPNTKPLNIGITQGVGEFFSEGSNINMDVTTKFTNCYYKVRGEKEWRKFEHNAKNTLYYVSQGTTITPLKENSFWVKGKLQGISKGKFFNKILFTNKKTAKI